MECKCVVSVMKALKPIELIDTLWNVNVISLTSVRIYAIELIDTLWNVNTMKPVNLVGRLMRINRYIMECKLSMGYLGHSVCTAN